MKRPELDGGIQVVLWFALAWFAGIVAMALTGSQLAGLLVVAAAVIFPMRRLAVEPRAYVVASGTIVVSLLLALVAGVPGIALLALLPWLFAWVRAQYVQPNA